MKKELKKISLKKKTMVLLSGKEKKQAQGGFTVGCGPFTYSEPWRCVSPSIGEC